MITRQLDKPGDSIECLQAKCQMSDPYKPGHDPKAPDGLVYYRAIGRATATITKKLREKAKRICPDANIQEGNKIVALKIIVRSRERFGDDTVIQASGADKASVFYTQGHTVATVKYAYKHVLALLARQS